MTWMQWSRTCGRRARIQIPADEVYEAARLLRRCTEITRVLVEQFTILETMLPTHFLAFRGKLEPASGFQSEQFRELEFLCGLKDEKMLRYHRPTPEAHAQLGTPTARALSARCFLRIPARHRHSAEVDDGAPEREQFDARARAILSLYKDERTIATGSMFASGSLSLTNWSSAGGCGTSSLSSA